MKNKTKFLTPLIYEDIIGGRYIKLTRPFLYYSTLLDRIISIPINFICDKESVPFLKATSNRGGIIHDYFSRKDSNPVVSKSVAADLYLEAQECRDSLLELNRPRKIDKFLRRHIKTFVVRIVPGYFHKLSIYATLNQVKGKK